MKAVWCNPKDPTTMIAELLRLGNTREPSVGRGIGDRVVEEQVSDSDGEYRREKADEACAP